MQDRTMIKPSNNTIGAALGLFHFNVQFEAGSPDSYHRYTREAICPFISSIASLKSWNVSIALSGSCLEFVAKHYPRSFNILGQLIFEGRIELISSLYTPAIWVAYPATELKRQIEENQRCLERVGLPQSKFFFAQESFFGEGLTRLAGSVEAAICKDDYMTFFYDWTPRTPIAEREGLGVIVGSNHILNHLNAYVESNGGNSSISMPGTASRLLAWASAKNRANVSPASTGSYGDRKWYWFHVGSGHHFCCPWSPNDSANFFCDQSWMTTVISSLEDLRSNGFQLTTIGQWFAGVETAPREQLPFLVEGSLNSLESGGVFSWMGRQMNSWEDDDAILSGASRSRIQLSALEALVSTKTQDDRNIIEVARKAQLLAEGSDSLGWTPTRCEVDYGRTASNGVLGMIGQMLDAYGLTAIDILPDRLLHGASTYRINVDCLADFSVGTFGLESTPLSACEVEPNLFLLEIDFTAIDKVFGVTFPYQRDAISYCPSGLDDKVVDLPIEQLRPDVVCLPLANGLLRIAHDKFVIKDLRYCHIAARVRKNPQIVEFGLETAEIPVRRYRWRFYLLRDESIDRALRFSNSLNYC